MKIALVHDYLADFGGAERVLSVLSEMYPEAPIYTAFTVKDSAAEKYFGNKQIIESFGAKIPGFKSKWHSPLRFLAPQIWKSFDFSNYDLVISSSSWYMTKGILVDNKTLHISYIHTPPRYLYGYSTSVNYQKYWPIKIYAGIVNKSLRQFDYESAQKVDALVANSKEVQARIKKYWRRESTVIYPPVELVHPWGEGLDDARLYPRGGENEYLLTGGRLMGPKHFDLAIKAANQLRFKLKVFGSGPEEMKLKAIAGPGIEFLGRVSEQELANLYAGAKAFLALADDEDFGMTPVEAMMQGTPVIAYKGGGFLESVIEGKTGVFVEKLTVEAVKKGIEKIEVRSWKPKEIQKWADRFSKQEFIRQMNKLIKTELEKKHAGVT